MTRSTRSRNWVFTLNNPLPTQDLGQVFGDVENIIVAKGQMEYPEGGTLHYQGFVCMQNARALSGMKRILAGAHWEVMKGTPHESEEYCSKEDTRFISDHDSFPSEIPRFFSVGEMPVGRPGARSDLVEVKALLDNGTGMREIADSHFGSYIRYNRGFEKYRQLKQSQRTWVTETTVYFGPPGTGKTRRALAEAGPDAYWLTKPNSNRAFWDGYDGQENIVIDEFYGWLPINFMKRLCDRYPMQVETKGSAVPFLGKKIWITSNSAPESWWPKVGLGAMARRLRAPLGSCWLLETLDAEPEQHNPVEQLPYFDISNNQEE